MKIWKQGTFFDFLAIMVLALAFVACDNENDTKHTHNFGTDWKYNETQHWHECNCSEKADIANHTFEGNICTVCRYELETPEFRMETIYIDLGEDRGGKTAVKVEGEFVASEWEGIAQRFQTALQANYDVQNNIYKNRYVIAFGSSGVITKIVIVKTSEFDKWSVSNRYLIYFNFTYIGSLSDEEFASNDVIRAVVSDMCNSDVP